MAALSAGPVGPSDTADGANKMLIMATCMSDGRLLKPSHPVMSVDSSFVYRSFKKDGPSGQLYAGYIWRVFSVKIGTLIHNFDEVGQNFMRSVSYLMRSTHYFMRSVSYLMRSAR